MRERTMLYGLPLRDENKPTVESLRSYVQRLAFAHCMKPRALLEHVIARTGGLQVGPAATFNLQDLTKEWSVHAGGRTGARLLEILRAATGANPSRGTLSHLTALVAEQHLVQTGPGRYCPLCVRCGAREDGNADPEVGHGQLLWEVSAVSACPVHGVRLRAAADCGAEVRDQLPVNERPSLSHVCRGCGSIGFRCIAGEPDAATAEEIMTAHQIGRLLAVQRETASLWSPATLQAGLRAALDAAFEGQVVRAAREVGLSRGTVCTWAAGKIRPNLTGLARIACHADLDLVEMFSGRAVRLSARPQVLGTVDGQGAPGRLRGYRRMTDLAAVEEALRQAVLEESPPSLKQFANSRGITSRHVRELWPALANALTAASALRQQQECVEKASQTLAAYEMSAASLKKQGISVTPKSLQRTSGLVAFTHNRPRVAALRQVIKKYSTS